MKLKVLVVDDSVLFRRVMSDALASIPDIEVVGHAANGKLALQKIRELRPHVVTLDLEMPEVDGLGVLDSLKGVADPPMVIVVSALTRHGGEITMKALEKGAFDFITKPDSAGAEQSLMTLRTRLSSLLTALGRRIEIRTILRHKPHDSPAPVTRASPPAPAAKINDIHARMNRLVVPGRPEIVLVGVSTGGPNALARILPDLPENLGVPMLIVQHMPPLFTQSLAENLSTRCALPVSEAVHGEAAEPNRVYIAPGGRQMRLSAGQEGKKVIQVTDDPPENNCRPAVDYLFRSVANTFPGRSMAVILTGMGSDGTLGLRLLKRQGCLVLAQDEASCVVYGMPRAAVDAGVVDRILPLEAMGREITAAVKGWKV